MSKNLLIVEHVCLVSPCDFLVAEVFPVSELDAIIHRQHRLKMRLRSTEADIPPCHDICDSSSPVIPLQATVRNLWAKHHKTAMVPEVSNHRDRIEDRVNKVLKPAGIIIAGVCFHYLCA